jgi:hypothetical protein
MLKIVYEGIKKGSVKIKCLSGMVVYTYNLSTWETEAGESLSSRPAWVHSKILSQNKQMGW